MIKKVALTLVGLFALVALLACVKKDQFAAMGAQQFTQPPTTVAATEVKSEEWVPTIKAIGSVAAYQGVTVSSETPGKVMRIAFESGATAREGDILIELDASSEQAQLAAAEATAKLADITLGRSRELFEKNTVSQSELDTAQAQALEAAAQVANLKAVIAKKVIRAPFSGRLGIRQVNVGQFIANGDPIVSLQSLDPVYVDFYVPQQEVSRVSPGMVVKAKSDAFPDVVFDGKLTAVNPDVDATTRNIKLQATFTNSGEKLRAGMFASVEVLLPEKNTVKVLPATAVIYAPYGDSVFVVEKAKAGEGMVARQQFVRLGQTKGDFVAISDGLNVGDQVVTTGAFKLRNGVPVTVDNSLAPKVELAPKPADS